MNIKQISKLCDVSVCTASRVLSGRAKEYRISKKTEDKILRLAAEIGYKPNYLAHSLNTGKTHSIGVVFANRVGGYLGGIMEGIEAHLRGTGYQMVVATCDSSTEIETEEVEEMLYRCVDGMIIYPLAHPRTLVDAEVKYETPPTNEHVPLVVVGRKASVPADQVMLGDYVAGREIAQKFLARGCSTFSVITHATHCSSDGGRVDGYMDELRRAGVGSDNIILIEHRGVPSKVDVDRLMRAEAAFSVNSALLIEYLTHLRQRKDISQVHFSSVGEIEGVELLGLKLDFLVLPSRQLGIEAAKMLLWRIENPSADHRYKEVAMPSR